MLVTFPLLFPHHSSGLFCLVGCGVTVMLVLMVTWECWKWLALAMMCQSTVGGCSGPNNSKPLFGLFPARCCLFVIHWKEKTNSNKII